MAVRELVIEDKIFRQLGEDGLRDLRACLWAVDCQTCGRFLGDDPPSLWVNDSIVFAVASLHHQGCQAPGWNDSGLIVGLPFSAEYVSFITVMLLVPIAQDGEVGMWPMMLVNPGLENVVLESGEDRRWRVRPSAAFSSAGLALPGREEQLGVPVGGAVARLTDTSVAVTFQVPPYTTYEAPTDGQVLECARARGGLLVGVTHALHPGEVTAEGLWAAMGAGQVLVGWVGFHGKAPARPPAARGPAVMRVLHWNDHHMSAGDLAGQAPAELSFRKARSWAESIIGAPAGTLLPWRPVDKEHPADGWLTINALSVQQWILRRHSDGWKLIRVHSLALGSLAESDNEARAWGTDVIRLRTGIPALEWQPGPTTPGSATLYASA